MKYLSKFETEEAYLAEKSKLVLPHVSLISATMGVMYDPLAPPAVEMIDLGLTSGILWAANNIGAEPGTTPESYYGNYYAWGEIETKSDYSWETYEHCNPDGNYHYLTKYCPLDKTDYWDEEGDPDNKLVLDAIDDVATQTYGSDYRMPTVTEIQELIDETDNEWVKKYNGISDLNGYKFMKKSDHSVFIFIPAADNFHDSSGADSGYSGLVWSSSLYSDEPENARALDFYSGHVGTYNTYRYVGASVRAVKVV